MLVRVRYHDNTYDMVKPWRLQEFIAAGKVQSFYRSDGWVVVGRDPLRRGAGRSYTGPERRKRENNVYRAAV